MKVEMVDQLLQMQLSNPTLPTTMHFGMGSERKGPRPTKKKNPNTLLEGQNDGTNMV